MASSRQKIAPRHHLEEEEDVWFDKEKLCREHIQEVLSKWKQIDDEIWAKVVVFERNRRVAKAYARAPVLTVNGSDQEFDGFRIGLNGFDDPAKNLKTEEYKRYVGHGIKIKMDEAGNVLIKRVSKCNVYVKNIGHEENSIGNEVLKLANGSLQTEKAVKLFDMAKFQANLKRELRNAYPDRRRLEKQCLSAVAFVKNDRELLDCPIWILIINVVAIEMLKSKLPPTEKMIDIRDRPRIPVPDEDPYSLPGQHQQGQYRHVEKPPRLPPRENLQRKSDKNEVRQQQQHPFSAPIKSPSKDNKEKKEKQYEDPYYHGLRARVSSFVSKTKSKLRKPPPQANYPKPPPQYEAPRPGRPTFEIHQHPMWYTRSVESGIDGDFGESPYSKIYGKIPVPRGYIPRHRIVHIGEWD